jgi:hypothetical protein
LATAGCSATEREQSRREPVRSTSPAVIAAATPTASASELTVVDPLERRDRLRRQLLGRGNVLADLAVDHRRGQSTIGGMSLAEALSHSTWGITLEPEDDVYTAHVTTRGMGTPLPDGTVDPMYDGVKMWIVRRHHFMTPVGCDKPDSPKSCAPCAVFDDYVWFFAPSQSREPGRFSMNAPAEVTTGTEVAEAAAQGMKLCR